MIGRKFACLVPTERTIEKLRRLSKRFDFDTSVGYDGNKVDDFFYHMTLLYSKEEDIDYPNTRMPLGHTIRVNGAVITTLGNAVVLRTTTNPKLHQVRNNLVRNLCCTHSHPDWIPHVSLTYSKKDIDNFGTDPRPYWYKSLEFSEILVETSK